MPSSKQCRKCGKLLPLSDYSPQVGGLYGRKSQCRQCCAEYQRQRRQQPEGQQYLQEYNRRPDVQERRRRRARSAQERAARMNRDGEYLQRPDVRERRREQTAQRRADGKSFQSTIYMNSEQQHVLSKASGQAGVSIGVYCREAGLDRARRDLGLDDGKREGKRDGKRKRSWLSWGKRVVDDESGYVRVGVIVLCMRAVAVDVGKLFHNIYCQTDTSCSSMYADVSAHVVGDNIVLVVCIYAQRDNDASVATEHEMLQAA